MFKRPPVRREARLGGTFVYARESRRLLRGIAISRDLFSPTSELPI